jgi:hypothetical protein
MLRWYSSSNKLSLFCLLIAVILYTVAYGGGVGPLQWVWLGELVPPEYKIFSGLINSIGKSGLPIKRFLNCNSMKFSHLGNKSCRRLLPQNCNNCKNLQIQYSTRYVQWTIAENLTVHFFLNVFKKCCGGGAGGAGPNNMRFRLRFWLQWLRFRLRFNSRYSR